MKIDRELLLEKPEPRWPALEQLKRSEQPNWIGSPPIPTPFARRAALQELLKLAGTYETDNKDSACVAKGA